eukprot:TRINITY_DN4812_c0_g3_i5.p1 TRINITY_DN4812_c0_g3~~TRINITY_DN4812_c0_g3_i5.p1  ORF type:complete len:405 (-),score=97.86 TRINITY_DN4812_c0_g3_i5:346-1560(-)
MSGPRMEQAMKRIALRIVSSQLEQKLQPDIKSIAEIYDVEPSNVTSKMIQEYMEGMEQIPISKLTSIQTSGKRMKENKSMRGSRSAQDLKSLFQPPDSAKITPKEGDESVQELEQVVNLGASLVKELLDSSDPIDAALRSSTLDDFVSKLPPPTPSKPAAVAGGADGLSRWEKHRSVNSAYLLNASSESCLSVSLGAASNRRSCSVSPSVSLTNIATSFTPLPPPPQLAEGGKSRSFTVSSPVVHHAQSKSYDRNPFAGLFVPPDKQEQMEKTATDPAAAEDESPQSSHADYESDSTSASGDTTPRGRDTTPSPIQTQSPVQQQMLQVPPAQSHHGHSHEKKHSAMHRKMRSEMPNSLPALPALPTRHARRESSVDSEETRKWKLMSLLQLGKVLERQRSNLNK